MKLKDAIYILEQHNLWRRGAEITPQSPFELGEAIDVVVKYHKEITTTTTKKKRKLI